ncbi:hypothetical protein ACHAWU_008357 [Discostella pseudostelligera]|uniref:Peptidase S54 rhomboid domain-containing protein n=1 Tax=Discostella pseudostelligera TaxID=259834 RepID=A0ABD3M6T9_9STRA
MPRENSGPPPPNPVLTAYESYLRDTPLITRYVLNATVISYFTSFFFNPAFLLANIPVFTIFKFQLYRIVTSPLICTDILSLFFTFMGFMNHGVRLEQSMGSSLFAALFFTLTIVTNTLFLILSILLWGVTSSSNYLAAASLGIWTVLLGIIAVECSEAPRDTKRRLFFIEVPALYYPLVLLALFSMFAGVKLPYCLGVAVGYAYGHGKLNRLKVKVETARKWENRETGGCLSGFVQRAGFVTLGMASGPNAWLTGNGGTGRTGDSSGGGGGGGPVPVRAPIDPASTTTSSFPSTGGRSLGGEKRGLLSRGTKPPKTAEERAAVLQRAAERRRQQQAQEDGDPGV